MPLNSFGRPKIWLILVVLAAPLLLSQKILWGLGALLVSAEPPQRADMIEVMGGDYAGNRILKGCQLVREGMGPRAYVSGGGRFFGDHESALAIAFAVSSGCPSDYFVPFRHAASNTVQEATELIPEFRRLGVRKLTIVTGPSHTARTRRVFRRLAPEIEIHMVAAPDSLWNGGYWWKTRDGRKVWLLEFTKTVADLFRL